MKKFLSALLCLIMLMSAVAAFAQPGAAPLSKAKIKPMVQIYIPSEDEEVPEIWEDAKKLTLTVGSGEIVRVVIGEQVQDANWVISANKEDVVDVRPWDDVSYMIGAENPGNAVVTFTQPETGEKARIQVKVNPLKVQQVYFTQEEFHLEVGQRLDLSEHVSVLPVNATNTQVSYKSNKKQVARVDQNGLVIPLKAGTARITVTAKDGSKGKAVCTLVITQPGQADPLQTTYRFFGIGQVDYLDTPLYGCRGDVQGMAAVYRGSSYLGEDMPYAQVKTYENLSTAGIINVLRSMASCGADENDVTVFYYSGHGAQGTDPGDPYYGALCGLDGGYVTVDTVQKYLDLVPGTVVVIMDSCFSGNFIQPKEAEQMTRSHARNVISTFASSQAKNFKALPDSPVASKYKVLVASAADQISIALPGYSLMTAFAAEGMGYNVEEKVLVPLLADADQDNRVSLHEVWDRTVSEVEKWYKAAEEAGITIPKQTIMAWPMHDAFPVIQRT